MTVKADLLEAVRDQLVERISEIAGRAYVVVQDAQGNQLLPMEAACPFASVSDMGLDLEWIPGTTARATYRIRVRVHVQDLSSVEAPVIGEAGAAALQDAIVDALQGDLLTGRITGVELAQVESCPMVDFVADADWLAVIGDVLMRYEMTES